MRFHSPWVFGVTLFEELGEEMAIESILKYLTERHQAKLLAELTKLKLIPKLLDEYDVVACSSSD